MSVGKCGKTFHAQLNDYLTPKNAMVIEADARRYARATFFLRRLNKHSDMLTILEYREIREMALEGKISEANEMLDEVLSNKVVTG